MIFSKAFTNKKSQHINSMDKGIPKIKESAHLLVIKNPVLYSQNICLLFYYLSNQYTKS